MDNVENKIGANSEDLRHSSRRQIEILFEFKVSNPWPTIYRAVKAIDGSFRMEKHGEHAKKFRPAMSCGAESCLYKFREALEFCSRNTKG